MHRDQKIIVGGSESCSAIQEVDASSSWVSKSFVNFGDDSGVSAFEVNCAIQSKKGAESSDSNLPSELTVPLHPTCVCFA